MIHPAYQLEGSECFGYRLFSGGGVQSFSAESEEEAITKASRLVGVPPKMIARRASGGGFLFRYTLSPPLWRRIVGAFIP